MKKQPSKFGYSVMAKFRLEGCRSRLKETYPEFIYPLNKLQFVERTEDNCHPSVKNNKLSTDGLHVFYTPYSVISSRLQEVELQIMHIVLHGILGHFLHQQDYSKHDYRDPLMDAQVAYLMRSLGLGNEDLLQPLAHAEQQLSGDFSMKQYYRAIREPSFGTKLYHIRWEISVDDHREWNYKEQVQQHAEQISQALNKHREAVEQFWKEAQAYLMEQTNGDNDYITLASNIAKQVAKRLHLYGCNAGSETELVRIKKRPVQNYRDLLRELFSVREIAKEHPDTIDPMLYHYGLDLYENIPLIEPLEYVESPALDLIVIAVDVSGSCCDSKTMEQFWSETYGCISQLKDACTAGEILVLQCDADIQKEEWVSLSDFEEAPPNIQTYGFGGTSFVPVFERINTMLQDGQKIEALLYLTDGNGFYPQTSTEVPTYFIMNKQNWEWCTKQKTIPDWITPIRLEEEK